MPSTIKVFINLLKKDCSHHFHYTSLLFSNSYYNFPNIYNIKIQAEIQIKIIYIWEMKSYCNTTQLL